jgi:error-prone DNA polymerase
VADYVELHAHSAYSFLDGASQPEELAVRALELGYDAFALTDHDGVYGSLEFAKACEHFGLRAITGAEVTLAGGVHLTLLCESQRGYANLCRVLTDAHAGTRLPGRERELLPAETSLDVVAAHAEGLVCLSGCARCATERRARRARGDARRADGCDRRRARAPRPPRAIAGRARRDPSSHLARRL